MLRTAATMRKTGKGWTDRCECHVIHMVKGKILRFDNIGGEVSGHMKSGHACRYLQANVCPLRLCITACHVCPRCICHALQRHSWTGLSANLKRYSHVADPAHINEAWKEG